MRAQPIRILKKVANDIQSGIPRKYNKYPVALTKRVTAQTITKDALSEYPRSRK